MDHKVTKLAPGWYEYRGYEIEKIGDHWNITLAGDHFGIDSAQTKSECIIMINRWEKQS